MTIAVAESTAAAAFDLSKVAASERWIHLNAEVMPVQSGNLPARTITEELRVRVNQIMDEMNSKVKERSDVIHGVWVARIGQLHIVMVGPGGTGKSFLARVLRRHITGSRPFETALDETTDPSQVFGPPDIKAMAEDGITRRIPDGMLPCATDAFIDEIMNGNTPMLHSLQPVFNERLFHNAGMPTEVPLRMVIAGTNKLTSDVDQAPFFDRIHLRYVVEYLKDRTNQMAMAFESVLRNAESGRGDNTTMVNETPTTVSLQELDQANKESLTLNVPDKVAHTFFDLRDEIMHGDAKVQISDRRVVESWLAVLANAWLRGHKDVQIVDLDILAHMWWNLFEQQSAVRKAVLDVTNPGESKAYALIKEFEEYQQELKDTLASPDLDERHKSNAVIQSVAKVQDVAKQAGEALVESRTAGLSTAKLEELINRTDSFKENIARDHFGIGRTATA